MTILFDAIPMTSLRETADGYLVGEFRAGRTGVQVYSGRELGMMDRDRVRVYRPPEEVFNGDAMASFTNLPVTLDHPPEFVNASNWKRFSVGFTGEHVTKDGGFIRVPLALKDAAAVASVKDGSRKELSFGYKCEINLKDGVTPEGEAYDAVMTNLRGNHLAVVPAGRAGSDCRIGDYQQERIMGLKTITQDGIPLETTDAGATVIDTLNKRIEARDVAHKIAIGDKDKVIDELRGQIAAKDKELGTKEGEITKLKSEALDAKSLDKMIADRADVIGKARQIADTDYSGKTPAEIRRAAVTAKAGDASVKDRSDDYVEALFDSLVASSPNTGRAPGNDDPLRNVMRDHRPAVSDAREKETEFQKLNDDRAIAWKNPPAGRA